jgi:periplasmic protein TonB
VTETALRFRDDPWPRLRWLVPAALGLTLLSQMAFLYLLRQPASPSPVPKPVDIQVIELPAPVPPAARPAPPERRSAPPPKRLDAPAPRPAPAPSEARIEVPRAPMPPVAEEPATPAPGVTVPVPPAPAAPSGAPPTQVPLTALPPSRVPQDSAGGTDSMSARAIYKPVPEIPEALRRRTIDLVAVARFRVDATGRAQVELVEPTPDPDLNRALLESLRRWRFFPATRAGRPIASTIDVRIPVSVK